MSFLLITVEKDLVKHVKKIIMVSLPTISMEKDKLHKVEKTLIHLMTFASNFVAKNEVKKYGNLFCKEAVKSRFDYLRHGHLK